MLKIRRGTKEDLDAVAAVEAECFPAAEAATKEEFEKRLSVYPEYFWLLEEDGKLISFINGIITDEEIIADEMYHDASYHKKDGKWFAVFGVNTIPEYRKQGNAERVMRQVIADIKEEGHLGCILTCKERLIHFYEKFGYENKGLSESTHGGAVWYDMQLTF